ncbi:uncharacterized protein GLRG_10999 [Colletotrichum graminicola M1.001]|uniref:Uncharacterized protein n=1 Tax=Colletotrichum graminicola (strain M1.001 / M2 / FGSC 10212) TaxID=645133 RepID=E3QY66_COLGM|nr:uncharacterized protein GLRG_10999 [Colletotrichum graminicola M1.001]EFQ35804.1 hypothetical protein GLRG_10999 [Colletotrichum graminicola M1.001]
MLDPSASRRQQPMDSSTVYSHSRTRTTSSSVFPTAIQSPMPTRLSHISANSQQHSRRSPSVNTFSTTSSVPPPAAYRTSPTNDLRRSSSSRSGGSPQPTGYVALLRKQKATVWCDRAQHEDPRLVAQQRAAKMRATLEVIGGQQRSASGLSASAARTSTGISATGLPLYCELGRAHSIRPMITITRTTRMDKPTPSPSC